MALKTYLGKITTVNFGLGGYQDATIGLHLCFEFDKVSTCCTSESTWDFNIIEHNKNCKWTEESRSAKYAEIVKNISNYLNQAKVRHVSDLRNIPVEIKMDGNQLHSWRILSEVL